MSRETEAAFQTSAQQSGQMNAAMAGNQRSPSTPSIAGFGRIGIPAVAAAAEVMRVKKPTEKPIHASFYLGSD